MSRPKMVTIKKNVYPDIQVVIPHKRYNDELEYNLTSFVKSENIIIVEKCNEDGIPERSYREPEFFACRMTNDIIEVCDHKMGWVPADDKLNEEYAEMLANKALLGDDVSEG